MKTVIIILLLSFNILYCQTLEDIKKLDTIYLLFKGGKGQKKIMIPNYDNNGYIFKENLFFKTGYIDTSFVKGRKTINFFKHISFLKKNQEKIIKMKFFEEYSRLQIVESFAEKPRIYYIIDIDEIKKHKIKLIEVNTPRFIIH